MITKSRWLCQQFNGCVAIILGAMLVEEVSRAFDRTGVYPEMTPCLFKALLGTKLKIISCYEGTTAIGLAMERGEVEGIGD
jgi:hypothetical protein